MRLQRILLALSLILLCTVAANAATYYVATPANGGSNSNPGTFSQPFATISYGVSQMSAGDLLLVRGGVYNEAVTIWEKNGSAGAWYHLKAYTGETPIIDGTGKSGNGVVVIGGSNPDVSSYIRIEGFEIRNGGVNGIYLYDAHHIEILNNNVHDNIDRGISVTSASGSAFGTTHDVLVKGNDVHHNVKANQNLNASGWQQGLSTLRATNVEIVENKVHENWGEGLDVILTDYATIRQNEVWDNFGVNIYLDNAQYTTVDRNIVVTGWSSTPSSFYRGGEPANGIYVANETYSVQNPSTNLTITNNIVLWCRLGFAYSNSEYGGGLHNTIIANNTFFETTDLLLWIQNGTTNVHDTTTVENNIFYAKSGQNYAYANSTLITYLSNCWYNGNSSSRKSGVGDVLANPQLANAGGAAAIDYKLTSGSPCINAGTTESAVTTDYWGTSRSLVYDIGAHEY